MAAPRAIHSSTSVASCRHAPRTRGTGARGAARTVQVVNWVEGEVKVDDMIHSARHVQAPAKAGGAKQDDLMHAGAARRGVGLWGTSPSLATPYTPAPSPSRQVGADQQRRALTAQARPLTSPSPSRKDTHAPSLPPSPSRQVSADQQRWPRQAGVRKRLDGCLALIHLRGVRQCRAMSRGAVQQHVRQGGHTWRCHVRQCSDRPETPPGVLKQPTNALCTTYRTGSSPGKQPSRAESR